MKQTISFCLVAALAVMLLGPVAAIGFTEPIEDPSTTVSTGFIRSEGGGIAPIVKVKWEMNENNENIALTNPLDDDIVGPHGETFEVPGAQFEPTGEWGTEKDIYVCAIATDPDGSPYGETPEIDAVYADIYYPEEIALGVGHEDNGCGEQHGLEIELQPLDKQTGYDLFCNNVRNNQPELVKWNESTLYDYDEVCAEDGELMKETARVYCKYTELRWEDPAGLYRTQVHAVDKAGLDSAPVTNYFEYLPLTDFEVDFEGVDYGNVKLNTHKVINGDLTWDVDSDEAKPSVRNIGNTRLSMTIIQDDMGLGKTVNGSEWWNVEWDARLSSDAPFAVYEPSFYQGDFDPNADYAETVLEDILELSQLEEMDFSILVSKFPLDTGVDGYYNGEMILGAQAEEFLGCSTDTI